MSIRSERRTAPWRFVALVVILAAAPAAFADHSDPASAPFVPAFGAPTRELPSQSRPLAITIGQEDHEAPVIETVVRFPKEWGLSFRSLRPAEKASSPGQDPQPAQTCTDVMDGLNLNGQTAARMVRAEVVGWAYARGKTETTRNEIVSGSGRRVDADPVGGPGDSPSSPFITWGGPTFGQAGDNRVGFLNWNEETQTARLCFYLYSTDGRLDQPNVPRFDYTARDHLFEATMTLTDEAWELRFDLRSFHAHPFLRREQLTIHGMGVVLGASSAGNWNQAPVAFSRTPTTIGSYRTDAELTTCALDTRQTGAPCIAGTTRTAERTVKLRVTDAQEIVHPFPLLKRPANLAIIRGTSDVEVAWEPLRGVGDETVKGYVVTVARPGEQASRHFRYEITDPEARAAAGLPWQTNPCGPSGDAAECVIGLRFPLPTVGGETLDVDGKYAVSVVSVYSDGHRSDGRCDDGTGQGVECPDGEGVLIQPPGLSSAEFLLRSHAWPLAFVDPGLPSEIERLGSSLPIPPMIRPELERFASVGPTALLVDFTLKRAEFVVFNPASNAISHYAPSLSIIGTNTNGGLVSFMGGRTWGPNFAFTGVIVGARATGAMILYDGRGLPGTPNGSPATRFVRFNGAVA